MRRAGASRVLDLTRRRFLQICGGAAALTLPLTNRAQPSPSTWRVGVGRDLDAYAATLRAVTACEDWAGLDLAGRTVVIKANLVIGSPATSGGVTDPECVRALADLALAGGAEQVKIVEGYGGAANWDSCGYRPLDGYAAGRVSLLDTTSMPRSLFPVPGGLTYERIWQRDFLLDPDVVFVSAAKLKLHLEGHVTLSMKNLIGLLPFEGYLAKAPFWPRFSMHHRGLHQAIVDMNLVRPIDFAVVEGIWGMEGMGPLWGTPVHAQTVLAGANAVAVDRLAVHLMGLPQHEIKHLAYASRLGLGPSGLDALEVRGDALVPLAFQRPPTTPVIEYPRAFPAAFDPRAGQRTCLVLWYGEPCSRSVQVLQAHDDDPVVGAVRELSAPAIRDAGFELLTWDGRADDGSLAPPGRYAVHVTADPVETEWGLPPPAFAVGWVEVADG